MPQEGFQAEDWEPGPHTLALWSFLSVALTLAGIFLFGALYAVLHSPEAGFEFQGLEVLWAIVLVSLLTAPLLVLHEWLHGLTMRRFGAQPEYGAGVFYRFLPYLYCTAPGHRFTRPQFAAVSVAPLVVISLVGALWVAFAPYGGWLVVPLAIHLGGCIGDLWFLGLLLRQPKGTLIEDQRTGVRIWRPVEIRPL